MRELRCVRVSRSIHARSSLPALAIVLFLTGLAACGHAPGRSEPLAAGSPPPRSTDVTRALEKLREQGVPSDSSGALLLRRYDYYLQEEAAGRAFADFRPAASDGRLDASRDRTSSVHDLAAFAHVRGSIDQIVENALAGRDALEGLRGFLERAYLSEVDQALDSYLVYVPQAYDPVRPHPLVVILHGIGESAYLPQSSPVHDAFLASCERHGVILVAPNGKHHLPGTAHFYRDEGERDVLQVISLAKAAYNVDPARVYLTGPSMGGFGTWYIGSRHPELFAAIAPVCGFGTGRFASMPRIEVRRLAGVPTYVTHGSADPTVPVSESRELVGLMKKAGLAVTYDELPGVRHEAWNTAYAGDQLLDRLLGSSRAPAN
jgi:poly(3-hydroxybutyrate) depolymerase